MGPAARADPDVQLMVQVSAGSLESFEELYGRYCDRACRVALAACGDLDRAQDAVQEGFLSVWSGRGSYRSDQGTVAAWILSVVRHRAIDAARRQARHTRRRANDDQLGGRPAPGDLSETVILRDEARRLQASLALLPAAQAEVITLAYYGQLSHTEIAAQLGLPAGTVKGRMRLGLQKLRADAREGPSPDAP